MQGHKEGDNSYCKSTLHVGKCGSTCRLQSTITRCWSCIMATRPPTTTINGSRCNWTAEYSWFWGNWDKLTTNLGREHFVAEHEALEHAYMNLPLHKDSEWPKSYNQVWKSIQFLLKRLDSSFAFQFIRLTFFSQSTHRAQWDTNMQFGSITASNFSVSVWLSFNHVMPLDSWFFMIATSSLNWCVCISCWYMTCSHHLSVCVISWHSWETPICHVNFWGNIHMFKSIIKFHERGNSRLVGFW